LGLYFLDKRPETDVEILSRAKMMTQKEIALGAKARRYTVDLPAHMAECDANYVRLLRIFPDLRQKDEQRINLSLSGSDGVVVFEVLEKGRYTTLLKIEFSSDLSGLALAATPEMMVRVYHDARSAEVVSYQSQNRFHGVYEYPNTRMRQRDEKVQVNRLLSEFLSVCLAHGASTGVIGF